jgi:alpha-tubulin suppressor-like RCC1 family protein/ligand-binding sensor domain-containing protein
MQKVLMKLFLVSLFLLTSCLSGVREQAGVATQDLESSTVTDKTVSEGSAITILDAGRMGGDFPNTTDIQYECYFDFVADNSVNDDYDCELLTGVTFNESNGILYWEPDYSQGDSNDVYEFRIYGYNSNQTTEKIFTITVNDTNRAPELEEVEWQTVNEGSAITQIDVNEVNTGDDTDQDGDNLSYECYNIPSPNTLVNCSALGITFNSSTGVMDWTPTTAQGNGNIQYEFLIRGGDGSLLDTSTFKITVKDINQAPDLTAVSGQTIYETEDLVEVDVNDNNSGNDNDYDGDGITYNCYYDTTVDGLVATTYPCSDVYVNFDSRYGVFNWKPYNDLVADSDTSGQRQFEFKIIGTDGVLSDEVVFNVTVLDFEENSYFDISAGDNHTCMIKADGHVYCQGRNNRGQLGDDSVIDRDSLVRVDVDELLKDYPGLRFKSIHAGHEFSCALSSNGEAYCWGANDSGQLGDGTRVDALTPVKVNMSAYTFDAHFKQIDVGYDHACGTTGGGSIYCWGSNDYGKLGVEDGDNTVNGMFINGANYYLATAGGVSISTDTGSSYTLYDVGTNSLPTALNRDIHLDSGGNIFTATPYGLGISADGGTTFSTATVTNGLGSNDVQGVFVDTGDNVYAATAHGLSISTDSGATFTNITTSAGLASHDCRDVYVDGGGNIYVATAKGVSISTDGGTSFNAYTTLDGLGSNDVRGILVDGSGVVYAATMGGLSISTNSGLTYTNKDTSSGLSSNEVYSVSQSGRFLYVGTANGLNFSVDSGDSFIHANSSTLHSTALNNIIDMDSANRIFITSPTGVGISTDSGATFTYATTADGLGSDDVRGLYIDTGDNIYAATANGIAISTDNGASFTNTTGNGLASVDTRAVFVDNVGYIYVATDAGLSISRDGGTNYDSYTTAEGLGSNDVYDVVIGNDGVIFVATAGGLSVSTDNGLSYINMTTAQGLASNYVKGVSVEGAYIYAATDAGMSVSYSGATSYDFITTADGLASNTVNEIHINASDRMYVLTDSGISISTNAGQSFTNYTTVDGLGDNNCNMAIFNSTGSLLVATDGGVSISTDEGVTYNNYDSTDGLGSNVVNHLYIDSNDDIYASTTLGLGISTDNGLNYTNYAAADGLGADDVNMSLVNNGIIYIGTTGGLTIAEDITDPAKVTNYTTADGLGSNTINDIYIDSDGNIFVATAAGFSVSEDGGVTYVNRTTVNGLSSNTIYSIATFGSNMYVVTAAGIDVSYDWGETFSVATGLSNTQLDSIKTDVAMDSNSTIFVSTPIGIGVSTDDDVSFVSKALFTELPTNVVKALQYDYADLKLKVATQDGFAVSDSPDGTSIFSMKNSNANVSYNDGDIEQTLPTLDAASPVKLESQSFVAKYFRKVTVGRQHTCGLAEAGQVYCWGNNDFGQVGVAYTTSRKVDVATAVDMSAHAGVNLYDIDAGGDTTCGLGGNGAIYCWGDNSNGQFADGTTTSNHLPQAFDISAFTSDNQLASIEVGTEHACANTAAGTVYCWGENGNGQVGDSSTTDRNTPVVSDMSGFTHSYLKKVTAGGAHSCGITGSGQVYCWGRNTYGQIGDNSTTQRTSPVIIDDSYFGDTTGIHFLQSVAGHLHSCGLDAKGIAYCWGDNSEGQLGDGTNIDTSNPTRVDMRSFGNRYFKQIVAGYDFNCALTAAGATYCWGDNSEGQLGNGNTTDSTIPVLVDMSAYTDKIFQSIVAGFDFACGLTADGAAYCWGNNAEGQLGDGSTTDALTPVLVDMSAFPSDNELINITAGTSHACGVSASTTSYCWGTNTNGRLGVLRDGNKDGDFIDPGDTLYSYTPIAVDLSEYTYDNKLVQMAAGHDHTCGFTAKGTGYCWGNNDDTQLGNRYEPDTDQETPDAVFVYGSVDIEFIDIASGHYVSCARTSNGKSYCWGNGLNGQLGDNQQQDSNVPSMVDMGNWQDMGLGNISVGFTHTCAAAPSGEAYCWGQNDDEQLGSNYAGDKFAPEIVDKN